MGIRLCSLLLAASVYGQQIVTTFAGTEWVFPANGARALDTPIGPLLAAAVDPQGRLVYADGQNHVVVRLETSGTVTVVAGNGVRGFSGDGGDALRASFDQPRGLAIDRDGNLFIADGRNFRVRRVSTNGIVTTVAGNGRQGVTGDGGPATAAAVDTWNMAFDNNGNLLLGDYNNSRLRRLDRQGIITTIGGNGKNTFSGDGKPATETSFVPFALHVDSQNRILVTDVINFRVYRIGTDGILTTIAGTGDRISSGDGGPAVAAGLTNASGVTTDTAGNVVIADTSGRRIRRINSAGIISTIVGGSAAPVGTTPVAALEAAVGLVTTIVRDGQGRYYVADGDDPRFLQVSADFRTVVKIAGNGQFKSLPPRTPASLVTMTEPSGMAFGPNGTFYYTESGGHRLAMVERDGAVTRVTGTGVNSCCNDGPVGTGRLSFPNWLAVRPDGAIYIAVTGSQRRRVHRDCTR